MEIYTIIAIAIIISVLMGYIYTFGYEHGLRKGENIRHETLDRIFEDQERQINEIVERRTKIVLTGFAAILLKSDNDLADRFKAYLKDFDPIDIIKAIERHNEQN